MYNDRKMHTQIPLSVYILVTNVPAERLRQFVQICSVHRHNVVHPFSLEGDLSLGA